MEGGADGGERGLDVGAGDAVMGGGAKSARAAHLKEDTRLAGAGREQSGVGAVGREVKDDHVGADGGGVERDARKIGEGFGKVAGVRMILGEPVHHGLEGDDPGGGKDADLAHAAADELAGAAGFGNKGSPPGEDGAGGGGETFGEAELDGVGVAGEGADVHVQGDGGVKDARAVGVDGEMVGAGEGAHLREIVGGERGAVGAELGVLETDEAGAGIVDVLGADGGFDVGEGERAIGLVGNLTETDTAEGGGSALLAGEDVRATPDDDFGAAVAVGEEGDEVAHRSAGDKERGFFANAVGGERLEAIDGGVFAKDVVAHLGAGHGLTHGGGGLSDGVGAEVDHGNAECRVQNEKKR